MTSRSAAEPSFRHADPETLVEIARSLTSELVFEKLVEVILDTAIRQLRAEMGILVLLNEAGDPEIRTARNFEEKSLPEAEVQMSRRVLREVTVSGRTACITDALSDPNYRGSESIQDLSLRSILCVPLPMRGMVAGAIYLALCLPLSILSRRLERNLDVSRSPELGH